MKSKNLLYVMKFVLLTFLFVFILYKDCAKAQQHPSIGLSSSEIILLQDKAETTHKDIWEKILFFTDNHIGTLPPSEAELPETNSSVLWRKLGESVVPFAFSYIITDDIIYSELTKDWILEMCEWSYWGPKSHGDGDLGAAHILYGVSIGYDWIYDRLSEEERQFILAKVEYQANILWEYAVGVRDAPWKDTYSQNHNHVNNVALGIAGFIFKNELAGAYKWEEQATNNIVSVMEAFSGVTDGSFHEGYVYWTYSMSYLLMYLDLLRDEYALDYFEDNDWLQNSVYFRLYGMMPDPVMTIDIADSLVHHRSPSNVLRKIAAEYENGYAEWIVQMRGPDHTHWNIKMCPWEFLWYNASIEAKSPTDLPLAWHFTDWGVVIMRSGWTKNDTFLSFKSGAPGGKYGFERVKNGVEGAGKLGAYHNHPDQNSFTLFAAKEYLATDNGEYQHPKLTISHNTILVNNKGQIGQGKIWFNENHPEFWNCPGEIIGFENTSSVSYVIGDASNSYPSALGLKEFTRQIFYLRPDLIVLVDNLNANYPVDYNWILRNRKGKFRVVRNSVFSIVNNSRLRMVVVKPETFSYRVIPERKGYKILKLTPETASASQRFVMVLNSFYRYQGRKIETLSSVSGDIGLRIHTDQSSDIIMLRGDGRRKKGAVENMVVGKYQTDGMVALLRLAQNNTIKTLVLIKGKELIDTFSGRKIITISQEGSAEVRFVAPSELVIDYQNISKADKSIPKLNVYTPQKIKKIMVNGVIVPFRRANKYISIDMVNDIVN
jgi:hypothetical protein